MGRGAVLHLHGHPIPCCNSVPPYRLTCTAASVSRTWHYAPCRLHSQWACGSGHHVPARLHHGGTQAQRRYRFVVAQIQQRRAMQHRAITTLWAVQHRRAVLGMRAARSRLQHLHCLAALFCGFAARSTSCCRSVPLPAPFLSALTQLPLPHNTAHSYLYTH